MKILSKIIIVLFVFTLFQCESDQSEIATTTDIVLDGTQGAYISDAEATSWLNSYKTSNPDKDQYHFFSAEMFNTLLRVPEVAGIQFYLARLSDNSETIVITGVKTDGKSLLFSNITAEAMVEVYHKPVAFEIGKGETLTGKYAKLTTLDNHLAIKAIHRYRDEDPTRLRGFYWGRQIIEELLSTKGAEGISFSFALNGKNELEPVLIAIDATATIRSNSGNNTRTEEETTYVDTSLPCPTDCPE